MSLNPEAKEYKPPSSSSRRREGEGGGGGGGARGRKPRGRRPAKKKSSQDSRANTKARPKAKSRPRPKPKPSNRPKPKSSKAEGHSEQATSLIARMEAGTYECIICMSRIRRTAAVWSCSSCYVVLHFPCLRKWSQKSLSAEGLWRCPHCQTETSQKPQQRCYCGKEVRPDANGFLLPGSCGSACQKMREGTPCPHPCSMSCHPGPCAPCTLQGERRSCHCGRTSYQLRCSEVDPGRSCGELCGKELACGSHRCSEVCHEGACPPCPETEQQVCYCGKVEEFRACGSGEPDVTASDMGRLFSCTQVCGQLLACGNHSCERVCHAGPCGECALSAVRTCPCGKTPLARERLSCLDPIPTCDKVCGRIRVPCGHACPLPCHAGECPLCTEFLEVGCRCGSTRQKVRCAEVSLEERVSSRGPLRIESVRCHQRCSELRSNCGRHRCNVVCCASYADKMDEAGVHICRLECGRKLRCGKHVCREVCHRGRCSPCLEASWDDWSCACGRTVLQAPIACGQKLPECKHTCTRERPCGHVDPVPHPCHEDDKACPPCVILVAASCTCGKQHRSNVACYQAGALRCSAPCDLEMPCGHLCEEVCHAHPPIVLPEPGDLAPSCGQRCNTPLATCEHKCRALCHPGDNCPAIVCDQETLIKCPCGRRFRKDTCNMGYGPEFAETNEALSQRALECDVYCEREKRRRQLAEAFGKAKPRAQEAAALLCLARAYPNFLRRVELQLNHLIDQHLDFDWTQESVIVPNVAFPSLTQPKIKLVVELSRNYAVRCEAFGEDSVWVTLTPDAVSPKVRISDLCESDAGPCALLVDDLNTGVQTKDVSGKFRRWKHTVDWIDKRRCIVVFESLEIAKVALNSAIVPYTLSLFIKQPDDEEDPRESAEVEGEVAAEEGQQQEEEEAEQEQEQEAQEEQVEGEQILLEQADDWEQLE